MSTGEANTVVAEVNGSGIILVYSGDLIMGEDFGKAESVATENTDGLTASDRFKQVFFNGMEAVTSFMRKFIELNCRKHLLEKRKNGNYSPEIVQDIFTLRFGGELMPSCNMISAATA